MTAQMIFLVVVIVGLVLISIGRGVNMRSKQAKRVLVYVGIALFAVGMIGGIASSAAVHEKPEARHGLIRHDPPNFRQD